MQRQMLIIKLDGDYYGIDVRLIQEVIKNYSLRTLPDAPNFIEGIISFRGSIVPLIKIKRLLNVPLFDLYKQKKAVILNFGEGVKIGMLVDEVVNIHPYDEKEIQSMETVSHSNVKDYIIGVIHLDKLKVAILDVFSMFFTNKGDFLYKQYFGKGQFISEKISKKEFYLLKEKVEKTNLPFTNFTSQEIIKYITRIATLRGESVEKTIRDQGVFSHFHFTLKQSRNFLFENKPDMYMISDLMEGMIKNKKKMRIWTLGNPEGEDAYSMSILFHSFEHYFKELQIINSDNDIDRLLRGKRAIFTQKALENIPMELWSRFFTQEKDHFMLKDFIKQQVIFDYFKPNPQFQPANIDFIYAPNYLSRNYRNKEKLIRNFYRALNPGGILALGLFENIEGFAKNLKKYYIKNRLVFIKES